MALIMDSKYTKDMSEEERCLAGGKKFGDKANRTGVFDGIRMVLFGK
jgi:hypothetical protein